MAKKGMKGKVAGKKKRIDVDEQFDAFLKEVSSQVLSPVFTGFIFLC